MKFLKVLKEYSLRDLIFQAIFESRSWLDCWWSTRVFRAKCITLGVRLGQHSKVWGKVIVIRFPGSAISIGKNVRVISRSYRYAFNIFPQSKFRTYSKSAKIIIGDGVGLNSTAIIARSRTVSIGNYTLIGGNCQIMDTDGHPLWPPESRWYYPGDEHDAPVMIGHNVFIGLNVIILKGATIGDNTVIAAGSVVTGEIPPNVLAAGVPARVIRPLDNHVDTSS